MHNTSVMIRLSAAVACRRLVRQFLQGLAWWWFTLGLAMPAGSSAEPAQGGAIRLDGPANGWTYNGLTDRPDAVTHAYPTPPIDRGGQTGRTLIYGHLKAVGKDRKPPTLVVNGNAMPLYADDEGRFARPYAFGTGSNGLEIHHPDGERKRVQFYEANPNKTQAKLRIIMAWDDNQAELDMHILTPDGQHAFFGEPFLTNGGGLDVDSVDGAGPEMFSSASPLPGTYLVYVNYWGNFGENGYHFDESTRKRHVITARITVIYNENSLQEKRETYVVPMRKIGDLTLVKSIPIHG